MKRSYSALGASELAPSPAKGVLEERDQEKPVEDYQKPVEESTSEEDVSEEEEDISEHEYRLYSDEEDGSTDEEEELVDVEDDFQSKDGNVLWFPKPPSDQRGMMHTKRDIGTPGPTKYAVSRVDGIKSAFQLFLTESIETTVLSMTNKEGRRVYGEKWHDMDHVDLQAYLGLLILAGVFKSNKEASRSLWDAEFGRAIFRATMPHKTFRAITSIIRFDDRETRAQHRPRDKLAAIRDVWDQWVGRLQLMYNVGADVTVGERLVPFRGSCAFKQFTPRKPEKYGIKIWAACCARTSYALNMQVYTGTPTEGQPETNQGKRVVLEMTEGLRGRTITCDNFFTSYSLGEELLKRRQTMVGTVRKNKSELPKALLTARGRARFTSKFAFTKTHTVVSYFPRKTRNVLLMSTHHKNAIISSREDKKPEIILDYNKNKGGVDTLDKSTSLYSCKRVTSRWPLVIFYNLVDVSAYNSFVLWTEIDPTWKKGKTFKRRLFLEELGRELVTPLIRRRQVLPRTPDAASIVLDVRQKAPSNSAVTSPAAPHELPARRRCQICPSKKHSKTRKMCQKCCRSVCKNHSIKVVFCHSCE